MKLNGFAMETRFAPVSCIYWHTGHIVEEFQTFLAMLTNYTCYGICIPYLI